MSKDDKRFISACIIMLLSILFIFNQRVALANQKEYITTLEEENVVLSDIVSSNTVTIDNGTLEIQELNELLQQSEKQYQDKIRNLEIENRLLQTNYDSIKKKYDKVISYKDKYKVAKKYLSKDEQFLVDYISKGNSKSSLRKYPFGTHIYIEGVGERVVMDTGGGVRHNQIDCAVDTHYNAVHWSGQGEHRVWVLKEG